MFFMVDQLSAKWLEAAIENDICDLPNIKALMASGTVFDEALANSPVCCPARATIATGISARGHGVLQNGYRLDPTIPTFMQSLQGAGYHTAAIGKLHFRPHYEKLVHDYKVYGFDETHITEDCRAGEWLDWVRENHPEHFDSVLATIWTMGIEEFGHYGENDENLMERIVKIKKDFKWATEENPRNSHIAYTLPFPKEVGQTAWITAHALDYINSTSKDQPFFVQVSYVQPHGPFGVPAEYLEKVDETKIPRVIEAEWYGDLNAPTQFKTLKPNIHADQYYTRKCYFADIAYLDEQLGKLVNCLKEKGLYDDTYILFTADHGELLGDHGFYSKGARHYDACIRVPLIVAGPKLAKGQKTKLFAQHQDICPTILEMAGTTLPPMPVREGAPKEKVSQHTLTHGASLLDICKGSTVPIRQVAYSESYGSIGLLEYSDWARTIRTDKYRYTYYAGDNGEQLFDLETDPDETKNLAYDEAYIDMVKDMKIELLELVISQDWPKPRRDLFRLGVH